MNNSSTEGIINSTKGSNKEVVIVYKECLKNHAAALGGTAMDGCGEFMPPTAATDLRCSACGCHRNFHRKEVNIGGTGRPYLPLCPHNNKGVLRTRVGPSKEEPDDEVEENGGRKRAIEVVEAATWTGGPQRKKRHRTKFTKDQKEKMLGFAEKVGWKMQKLEEGLVQQFCQEIGIKRRVLKVWMHNNKHHFVKENVNSTANGD